MNTEKIAEGIIYATRIACTVASIGYALKGDYAGAAYWLAFVWVAGQK